MRNWVASLVLALALAGCASAGGSGQPGTPRRDPNLITAEEIAATHAQSVTDAVRQLRPRWLASQGATTQAHGVQFMIDNVFGLRSVNINDVLEMRYMDASEATMRYGTGFTGGLIVVKTRAGGGS